MGQTRSVKLQYNLTNVLLVIIKVVDQKKEKTFNYKVKVIQIYLRLSQLFPQLTFTRWHEGQPNDGRSWNQDCVEMGGWVSIEKRKWNDADCSRRLKFFCEKSQIESSRGTVLVASFLERSNDFSWK